MEHAPPGPPPPLLPPAQPSYSPQPPSKPFSLSAAHANTPPQQPSLDALSNINPIVVIVVIGITALLIVVFGIVVWIIHRRRGRSSRDLLNDDLTDLTAVAVPMSLNDLATSKQWIGDNPTEPTTRESYFDGPRGAGLDRDEVESLQNALFLEAANLCRSLPHERTILRPLVDIGHRTLKYNVLVSDGRMNAVRHSNTVDMQTTINTDALTLFEYANKKRQTQIRSLLTSLRHSHLLPIYDVSVSPMTSHYFLLSQWCRNGSLRDFMHQTDPTHTYTAKYFNEDDTIKRGRPLSKRLFLTYSWQILLALVYLQQKRFPHYHLHTGNIFIHNDRILVGGYEGAIFGFRNRLHRKLRRITSVNPIILSLACIFYEMATGDEPIVTQENTINLRIHNNIELTEVNDIIQYMIYNHNTLTIEDLLAHKLYRISTGISPVYNIEEDDQPPIDPKITKRIVIPIIDYFDKIVYKRRRSSKTAHSTPSPRHRHDGVVTVDIKTTTTPSSSSPSSRQRDVRRANRSFRSESSDSDAVSSRVSVSSGSSRSSSSRGSASTASTRNSRDNNTHSKNNR